MVRQMNRTASRYIVKPIVELAADSVRIGDNDFTGPDVVAEGEDEISRLVQEILPYESVYQGKYPKHGRKNMPWSRS